MVMSIRNGITGKLFYAFLAINGIIILTCLAGFIYGNVSYDSKNQIRTVSNGSFVAGPMPGMSLVFIVFSAVALVFAWRQVTSVVVMTAAIAGLSLAIRIVNVVLASSHKKPMPFYWYYYLYSGVELCLMIVAIGLAVGFKASEGVVFRSRRTERQEVVASTTTTSSSNTATTSATAKATTASQEQAKQTENPFDDLEDSLQKRYSKAV